jgi:hypothetical protein
MKFDRHEFEYLIYTTAVDDTHDLIVDVNNGYYYFMYTENDRIKYQAIYKRISDDRFNLPVCVRADEGKVYFQNFYNEVGYVETNMEFVEIDPDKKQAYLLADYLVDEANSSFEENGETFVDANFSMIDGELVPLVETYSGEEGLFKFYSADIQDYKLVLNENLGSLIWQTSSFFLVDDSVLGLNMYGQLMNFETGETVSEDEYYKLFYLGDGSLAGRNISTGNIDRISPDKEKIEVYDAGLQDRLAESAYAITDIRDMSAFGDRTLLSLYDENGASLLEYKDGCLSSKKVLWHMNMGQRVLLFIGSFAGGFVVTILLYLFYSRVLRRFIMVRITAILVVILLVLDYAAYNGIETIMNAGDSETLNSQMEDMAWQLDSKNLVADIDDFHDKNSDEVLSVRSELFKIQQGYSVSDLLNLQTYYYGVDRQDESSLLCISDYQNENRMIQLGSDLQSAAETMLKTGEIVYCDTYDSLGQMLRYMLYPTRNESGDINGCYVLNVSMPEIQYETSEFLDNIIKDVLVMNIVLTALCLVLVYFLILPLSGLRKKANGILNGEACGSFGRRSRRKKYLNEIDLIIAHFAEMADTVEQNMEEISKLRESNQIYFSDSILEALGKQSINQINFREKVTEIFYTISVRLPEYYDKYENFERLLKDLLVQLKLYQGFIGEIHGNRLLICSKLADFENVMFFFGRENPDIQAVFDKTSVQISVVGEGERYSFSVTLTEKDRERRLTEYHHSVKGFLLATAQAVRNDKAASLCCVGILNDGEYVYEINMDNKNRRKKLIRGLMREAVELYSKGNYRQARFLFARVLMKNPGNAAAAYYIRSIDDVINEGRNVGWL